MFCVLSRFLFSSTGGGYFALNGFLLGTTCVHRYFPFSPRCMPPVTVRRMDGLNFSGGFKSCHVD